MKTTVYRSLWMTTVLVMLSMTMTYAQTQDYVRAKIPFDFTVGSTRMAAGEYLLRPHPVARGMFQIRSETGKEAVLFRTIAVVGGDGRHSAELIFNRYGDHYFLSQAWTGLDSVGREVTKSSLEKEIASKSQESHVAGTAVPVKVAVAAHRP